MVLSLLPQPPMAALSDFNHHIYHHYSEYNTPQPPPYSPPPQPPNLIHPDVPPPPPLPPDPYYYYPLPDLQFQNPAQCSQPQEAYSQYYSHYLNQPSHIPLQFSLNRQYPFYDSKPPPPDLEHPDSVYTQFHNNIHHQNPLSTTSATPQLQSPCLSSFTPAPSPPQFYSSPPPCNFQLQAPTTHFHGAAIPAQPLPTHIIAPSISSSPQSLTNIQNTPPMDQNQTTETINFQPTLRFPNRALYSHTLSLHTDPLPFITDDDNETSVGLEIVRDEFDEEGQEREVSIEGLFVVDDSENSYNLDEDEYEQEDDMDEDSDEYEYGQEEDDEESYISGEDNNLHEYEVKFRIDKVFSATLLKFHVHGEFGRVYISDLFIELNGLHCVHNESSKIAVNDVIWAALIERGSIAVGIMGIRERVFGVKAGTLSCDKSFNVLVNLVKSAKAAIDTMKNDCKQVLKFESESLVACDHFVSNSINSYVVYIHVVNLQNQFKFVSEFQWHDKMHDIVAHAESYIGSMVIVLSVLRDIVSLVSKGNLCEEFHGSHLLSDANPVSDKMSISLMNVVEIENGATDMMIVLRHVHGPRGVQLIHAAACAENYVVFRFVLLCGFNIKVVAPTTVRKVVAMIDLLIARVRQHQEENASKIVMRIKRTAQSNSNSFELFLANKSESVVVGLVDKLIVKGVNCVQLRSVPNDEHEGITGETKDSLDSSVFQPWSLVSLQQWLFAKDTNGHVQVSKSAIHKLLIQLVGVELNIIVKLYLQAMKLATAFFSAQKIGQHRLVPQVENSRFILPATTRMIMEFLHLREVKLVVNFDIATTIFFTRHVYDPGIQAMSGQFHLLKAPTFLLKGLLWDPGTLRTRFLLKGAALLRSCHHGRTLGGIGEDYCIR